MLMSDGVYKRIPLIWLLAGLLVLFLGLLGGTELVFFYGYMALAAACIVRGAWIYQARWKRHSRNNLSFAKETVIIKHPIDSDTGR